MESNWRWNVYEVGLYGTGFRLCARRFKLGANEYWLGVDGPGATGAYTFIRRPDGTLDSFLAIWYPGLPTSFPYGYSVDPD